MEHQIVISYQEDDYQEVYCNIHLVKRNFFRRLWISIRYIFGYRSRYGNWDEFIFNPDDADKLQKIVDILRKKAVK